MPKNIWRGEAFDSKMAESDHPKLRTHKVRGFFIDYNFLNNILYSGSWAQKKQKDRTWEELVLSLLPEHTDQSREPISEGIGLLEVHSVQTKKNWRKKK